MVLSVEANSSRVNRLAAVFEGFWQGPRTLVRVAMFWILLLSMAAVRAHVAMYGTRCFSHDGFLVLDGAWRMLNGQRPHVDFNSLIGPAAYLPTVVGFLLASNTAAGFGYGQALMALFLGAWAYFLGCRLYQAPRALYALCVASIAVDPAQMGFSPFMLSPGMTYNRYSYALLGILLLECLSGVVDSEFFAGLSTGAVISILAFTKVTSFIIAVMLVFALMSQRPQTRQRWLGLFAGAALVGLPFLWYIRFDVLTVIRDIAITVAAKHVLFTDLYLLNSIAVEAGMAMVITFSAFFFLLDFGDARAAKPMLLAGCSVVVASLLLIFTNFQQAELPLLGPLFLVVGHRLLAKGVKGHIGGSGITPLVFGAGLVFAGVTVCSAIVSLADAQWVMMHSARAAPPFEAPALRQFVPLKEDIGYTSFVNDGMKLLQQQRKPGERIMSLDFTNPFSFGLQIPPAEGGSTNLMFKGTFDAEHKVSPEKLFGAADLVMLPKYFSDPNLSLALPSIYGPFLESHFKLIGESTYWKLYRRADI